MLYENREKKRLGSATAKIATLMGPVPNPPGTTWFAVRVRYSGFELFDRRE